MPPAPHQPSTKPYGAPSSHRNNARIGVVFVFQYRLIRLFTWRTPTHTLSFLAVYTFICLNPYLLAALPLFALLFFIMVPAFLVRHPPPTTNLSTESYSIQGPPLAPPATVKPAAEMSKDFFRNMRDLQNSMDDFARLHDAVVAAVVPATNFSDEARSSAVFLVLLAGATLLLLTAHRLPWRLVALVVGWAAAALAHPALQHRQHHRATALLARPPVPAWLDELATRDIALDAAPETREVEIFELQRKGGRSGSDEWEGWVFGPSPYDALAPDRIAGRRPRGTRFFDDVRAPSGWGWRDKKWTLDLLSREWVEERCIAAVEVEMEGERWVYDILYDSGGEEEEEEGTGKGKGKGKRRDWEEGNGLGKTGQWRRRRWVRTVERRPVD